MTTVSIVDDDAHFCRFMSMTLSRTKEIHLASIHYDAEEAFCQIPQRQPDVALVDIRLPGMDGIECIQKLRDINPPLPTRFIVLTEHEDSPLVFDALKAGARGYLLKDCTSLNELAGSIRDVINDGAVMSPAIARKVIRYFRPQASPALASLSKRETEVLNCIADGLMYKEIAPKLGISMGTVCKHVAAIYAKLHVHSRTEAALKCAILLRR